MLAHVSNRKGGRRSAIGCRPQGLAVDREAGNCRSPQSPTGEPLRSNSPHRSHFPPHVNHGGGGAYCCSGSTPSGRMVLRHGPLDLGHTPLQTFFEELRSAGSPHAPLAGRFRGRTRARRASRKPNPIKDFYEMPWASPPPTSPGTGRPPERDRHRGARIGGWGRGEEMEGAGRRRGGPGRGENGARAGGTIRRGFPGGERVGGSPIGEALPASTNENRAPRTNSGTAILSWKWAGIAEQWTCAGPLQKHRNQRPRFWALISFPLGIVAENRSDDKWDRDAELEMRGNCRAMDLLWSVARTPKSEATILGPDLISARNRGL